MKSIRFIFLLFSLTGADCFLTAQTTIPDTIKINDVVVRGRPTLRGAGFLRTSIDSLTLTEHLNSPVAEILSSASLLYIKSYGPGGIATVSFRGSAASHTMVTWNGINLNSPMLGQTDILLLPAVAADEITLYYGGSGMAAAQGGLGGVIDLITKPLWNNSGSLDLSASAGGYGRYSGSLNGRYGSGQWRFATRFNYNSAENRFSYLNSFLTSEPVREVRLNAAFLQKSVLQEAWLRSGRSVTGFRIWLQSHNRNLPVPVNISPLSHDENLSGMALRTMVTHDFFGENTSYSALVALISDKLTYSDNATDIYAPSSFNRLTFKGSVLWNGGRKTSVKGEITSDVESVASENYASVITRNISVLSLSSDYMINSQVDLNLSTLLPVVDGGIKTPDFSVGVEVKPFKNRLLKTKANISSRSRIPTMNDLHWIPGGNKSLETERALSSELAFSYEGKPTEDFAVNFRSVVYYNNFTSMIIWQPGSSGLWSPLNSGRVRARGLENTMSVQWTQNLMLLSMSASYSYTRSSEDDSDIQMIYVPMHMANGVLRFTFGQVSSALSARYSARRFITSDNLQYLPAFSIADLRVGIKTPLKTSVVETSVVVENLFNIQYQAVAYHPMPGRSAMLSIKWSFNGKSK
jgi:vitamin B12 transporter